MFVIKRLPPLVLACMLAVLAGCGTTHSGTTQGGGQPGTSPTPAPKSSAQAPSPGASRTTTPSVTPAPSRICPQIGASLTAIRAGRQGSMDRLVFEFSGGLPRYEVYPVSAVYADPKGDEIPLAGQAYLRLVFHGASAWCQQPATKTYAGPSVLTPFYPRLLAVSAAGDFEQVLSFGIGLAAKGSYRAYSLTGPNRVVLDFSHVPLGPFPGIWGITSWQQYWASQYSWNNGHQPWLGSPAMVVEAWARSRWGGAPVMHQVDANTFKVTEPSGRVDTVTGTQPATTPGPWVITSIAYGPSPA